MNIIDIDELKNDEIITQAINHAKMFCNGTRISAHKAANPLASVSWINFIKDYDFISFTVNNNPFSIYLGKEQSMFLDHLKSTDYSFPVSCVSQEVVLYMQKFIEELNNTYDFKSIKYEKNIKEECKPSKIRSFFNYPQGSKSEFATDIANVKIDLPSLKNKIRNKYELLINDVTNNVIYEPKNISELIKYLPKYQSYKIYIKPCKLVSSSVHFPGQFKLMWQVFKFDIIPNTIDEIEYLKSKITKSSSDENISTTISNQLEQFNIENDDNTKLKSLAHIVNDEEEAY